MNYYIKPTCSDGEKSQVYRTRLSMVIEGFLNGVGRYGITLKLPLRKASISEWAQAIDPCNLKSSKDLLSGALLSNPNHLPSPAYNGTNRLGAYLAVGCCQDTMGHRHVYVDCAYSPYGGPLYKVRQHRSLTYSSQGAWIYSFVGKGREYNVII